MRGVSRYIAMVLVVLLSSTGVAQAQWVFVARKAVGVVRQMAGEAEKGQGSGYDSATVILNAPAENVYRKAVEVIKASTEFRLTRQTDSALTLEISDGKRVAGLQVTPIDEGLSQLLIVSNTTPSQESGSSLAVKGVLRVCNEMAVQCSAATPPANGTAKQN